MRNRISLGLLLTLYGCGPGMTLNKLDDDGDRIRIANWGAQCQAILAGGWYCVGREKSFMIEAVGDSSMTIVCQGSATEEDRAYLHGVLVNDRC